MTKTEWLTCTDPQAMLSVLFSTGSDRKLRLTACAFCRLIWDLITDEQARLLVELAELFADGQADDPDLITTRQELETLIRPAHVRTGQTFAWSKRQAVANGPTWTVLEATGSEPAQAVRESLAWSSRVRSNSPEGPWTKQQVCELQATIIRDILGNDPSCPVAIDPRWRMPGVLTPAQVIYENRAFDRLPVLADALEEAGCTDAAILEHCRGPGPHVRGCWVVDLLLGKS